MAFHGLRVLSFESRRAPEIETLIRKHGGQPFVAPSVRERAAPESGPAFDFARRLTAGEFQLVVCMTGVGLEFLAETLKPSLSLPELSAAFSRVVRLARGPKPSSVLRRWGIPADIVAPEPNTWREIVAAVGPRTEMSIALLEHGRANADLEAALVGQGRNVSTFAIYQWDLPEDTGPLEEAARRIAAGACDVILFTSSIQLEHLLAVAHRDGASRSRSGRTASRRGRLHWPHHDRSLGLLRHHTRRHSGASQNGPIGPGRRRILRTNPLTYSYRSTRRGLIDPARRAGR
ncbi:MAG: uroporphyrinogen-III synthase [Bryobacteraceae bacterium]